LTPKEGVGRALLQQGARWLPKGEPEEVQIHDFIDPEEPKAIPYGFMMSPGTGWVNVGCDHDTASFAVARYGVGGKYMGREVYPEACIS